MKSKIEEIAIDFINTVQNRTSSEQLMDFYHPDIEHIEFPNALAKNKIIRNLEDLKVSSEKGKQVLQKEEYEILKSYSFNDTVILEVIWTGTLAIPLGNVPVGGQMKAYFAQFFEFKDDKIIRQRNYDCFEPFN